MSPYILSEAQCESALNEFQQLQITGPESGDRLFETYGCGNVIEYIDRPFERFHDYKCLLKLLNQTDPEKYNEIHKGTPFYFLFWCAFDMRAYEIAMFYLDAAVSEDMRVDPNGWANRPASQFLQLSDDVQVAERVRTIVTSRLESQLGRFHNVSGNQITLNELMSFVDNILQDDFANSPDRSKRSIVSALYTFLLEYDERLSELELRSRARATVEPVLSHLFKGALIFESLLKQFYPTKNNGNPCKLLRDIFHETSCPGDFNIATVQTTAMSLQDIHRRISTATDPGDIQTSFDVTSLLRNTTAHNLVWDDIFQNTSVYTAFIEATLNAIFYIIAVKHLDHINA